MRRILVVMLAFSCFFLPATAKSAGFPSKPIQLVVPYKPGGGSDVSARIFAQCLERTNLPEKVLVRNINGARGKTGEMYVMHARPDGYTLLWQHQSLDIAYVTGRSNYTYKAFKPVALTVRGNAGIFVPKSLGITNVKQLVKRLKSNPGSIAIGVAINGLSHFGMLSFIDYLNLPQNKLKFVGMSGDKNRIVAMMQGNLQLTCIAVNAALPYVKSGDIVPIGILSDKRDPSLPDVPTMKELGYDAVMPTDYFTWAPKGTPENVVKVLQSAWTQAASDPQCAQKMKTNSLVLMSYKGKKLDQYLAKDLAHYKLLAKKYGMGAK